MNRGELTVVAASGCALGTVGIHCAGRLTIKVSISGEADMGRVESQLEG